MRALGVVALAALVGAGALAQDGKKKDAPKERLPFHWKQLDLTEEQKAKYRKLAVETEKKKDALTGEIEQHAAKLKQLRAEFKRLDAGDEFEAAVLNPAQREKLSALKADAAKRSADKSVKKAEKLSKELGKKAKAGEPDGAKKADKSG